MSDDRHDAVSRRAYELWEQEGGEHGRHEDHWHRATRELDTPAEAQDEGHPVAPDGTTLPAADAAPAATRAAKAPAKPRKPKTPAK